MLVHITAYGDPDAEPVKYSFERGGDAEDVFIESVRNAAAPLRQGRRINISQTLLLLAARVIDSLDGGAGEAGARQDAAGLLSPDQVMIGVPEMTRTVQIDIPCQYGGAQLTLCSPVGRSSC